MLVETGRDGADREMNLLNHNGLDVGTPEAVEQAYAILIEIKEEWGLRKVQKPRHVHGDTAFDFCDFDGNWWEILSVRAGGYARATSTSRSGISPGGTSSMPKRAASTSSTPQCGIPCPARRTPR